MQCIGEQARSIIAGPRGLARAVCLLPTSRRPRDFEHLNRRRSCACSGSTSCALRFSIRSNDSPQRMSETVLG